MKISLDWLISPLRKKLLQTQTKNEEVRGELLEMQLNEQKKIYQKPYRNLRLIDTNVIVTLQSGETLTNSTGGRELFDKIKLASDEQEILELFITKQIYNKVEKVEDVETQEERDLVRKEWDCLLNHPDFQIKDNEVYLKGVSMPLPAVIVGTFIELVEKIEIEYCNDDTDEDYITLNEQYNSLKLFTLKLALNPIQSSREDALRFVKEHHIKITSLGNLIMYRAIVSIGKEKPKDLVEFISKEYLRIKKWKKSPANYHVWAEDDGSYTLHKGSIAERQSDGIGHSMGNLAELYNDLGNLEENRYTDAYTRSMDIRVGTVYSLPEEDVDIDSRQDCSAGLHVGTKDFGFGGNGDTMVLCLVNPTKIRSIPYANTNKMRVSEMFIASVIKEEDMHEDIDIVHFDEEYHAYSLEELQESLADKTFEVIKSQDAESPVTQKDMENIAEIMEKAISSRVVNV